MRSESNTSHNSKANNPSPSYKKRYHNQFQRNKYGINIYPNNLFEKLEFDKILELLEEKCQSTLGKAYIDRINLTADPTVIIAQLNQVHEFKELIMVEETDFPSGNYIDLKDELKWLAVNNSVLSEEQVFKVYRVLKTVIDILRYFNAGQGERKDLYPHLVQLITDINVDKNLINQIRLIIDEDGRMRTDASKELLRIRRASSQEYRDLDRKFKALISNYKKRNWLADSAESIRGGRRVLAVPSEFKRKIRGIIHDESNTGSTSFIEPEETLQISNRIVELQQEEKREIYRILKELTNKIRPYEEALERYQRMLGLFDFIRAKALLAWDMDAHKPHLSEEQRVEIFNARHPLLYLKNKSEKKTTVPLNLELSIAERILIVSGPNAGGKSVLLKTIGLLQMMLQAGLLIPANDHTVMSIYRNIFVDIGDEQSIENDLSTYSSHLKNMRYFVDNANGKTLILMDEFGSGTDPSLGGAIAEAILERLVKKFCYGVITTHYANLKVFATNTKGVFNGAMSFNYTTLSPKYKLEIGKPGSSFAFELATKSGLSKELIARAKSKVDTQYQEFDELLTNLQREKEEASAKEKSASKKERTLQHLVDDYKRKIDKLNKERKEILLDTRQKALLNLESSNKKFETLMKQWNENKGEKAIIKQIKTEVEQDKRRLAKTIEILKDNIYYRDAKEQNIMVDSFVRLREGTEIGQVVELRKGRAVVAFGELRTLVKTKSLVTVEAVTNKKPKGGVNLMNGIEGRSEFDSNIDVRGLRRQEALSEVENLLDKALLYSVDELKIVHGIGDGILRRSIRELLRRSKFIKSVRDEDPQYGGSGVSIVELK